jgi:hypothetical protein
LQRYAETATFNIPACPPRHRNKKVPFPLRLYLSFSFSFCHTAHLKEEAVKLLDGEDEAGYGLGLPHGLGLVCGAADIAAAVAKHKLQHLIHILFVAVTCKIRKK